MNVQTAIANQMMGMVNQAGPNGKLTYNQIGNSKITGPGGEQYTIPRYEAMTKLSPMQANINKQGNLARLNTAQIANKQTGRVEDTLSKSFNLNGIAGADTQDQIAQGRITKSYGTDWSKDRQRVEDALMSRLNPSLQQDKGALEARLASQGIAIGSEAYQAAMGDFGQQSNDARMSAILAGGTEQSRLAGLDLSRAQFQNSAQAQQFGQDAQQAAFGNQVRVDDRQRAIQERLMTRNQPLNEITALMSGSQVSMPQFQNTPGGSVANTDYAGLVANRDALNQNTYNQKMAGWNSLWGGIGGGIGSLIGGGR